MSWNRLGRPAVHRRHAAKPSRSDSSSNEYEKQNTKLYNAIHFFYTLFTIKDQQLTSLPLCLLPVAIQFLPLYHSFSAEQPLSFEERTPRNDVAGQSTDQCVSQQRSPREEVDRKDDVYTASLEIRGRRAAVPGRATERGEQWRIEIWAVGV